MFPSSLLRPGLIAVLLSFLFGLLQTAHAYTIHSDSTSFDDPKEGMISKVELKDPNATFEVSPMTENWDCTGSLPLKVKITNRLEKNETWQFDWQSNGGKTIHTFAVSVPAKSTVEKIVQLPPLTILKNHAASYVDVDFTIRGPLSPQTEPVLRRLLSKYRSDHKEPPVLVDPAIDKAKIVAQFSSSSFSENINRLHLDQWPADPMTYFTFHGIYLKEKTWNALDSSRKDALNQWVSAGGRLWIVLDEGAAPRPENVKTGDGRIRYLKEDYKKLAESIEAREGQLPPDTFPIIPPDSRYELETPMWFVILVLLAFAALVGPVSLFYWAPAGKRQKLFLVIPVISLSFSLLLAAFILITEGFGGKGIRMVRIVLCPDSHMAAVKQTQQCITGILSNTSFPLNDRICCAMDEYPFSSRRHYSSSSTISSTEAFVSRQNNRAGGGYFSSRMHHSHQLLAFTPTRARLTLSGEENAPVMLSTWPTPLRNFLYTDDRGVIWESDLVAPGQKTALRKHPRQNRSGEEDEEEEDTRPRNAWFSATADSSELAPIPTHPDITWEKNIIELSGPVTREPSSPQPSR